MIGSSTSGVKPSELQQGAVRPAQIMVCHPFNPVYLLPLVELCGGEKTAPETIEQASAIYASIGMHPLHVRHEIDGFIADRLLEAVWREALHMINDGVATVEEIDRAIPAMEKAAAKSDIERFQAVREVRAKIEREAEAAKTAAQQHCPPLNVAGTFGVCAMGRFWIAARKGWP